MMAAKKGQLDAVLVWRFARSTQALVNALREFQSLSVDFISYQESIDTTTPTGELIFTSWPCWPNLKARTSASPYAPA